MSLRSLVVMVIVCLVWAANTIVSKLAVDDLAVPPLFYAAMRALIVVACLLPLLRPLPARLWQVLLVGFAISGGSFALLFVGLESASPSAAAIVSLSGAPLTVLFAILLLGERVRWRRGLGIALAFIGVVVAVASPAAVDAGTGLLFVGGSAIVGALGTVFVKRLSIDSVRLQGWAAVASVAALVPLTLVLERGQWQALAAAPLEVGAALVFSAVVVSIGAHTAYFRLLQDHDANLVAPLTLMTPLFTIALGAAITGDAVGWQLLAGGALAASGVLVILVRPSALLPKQLLVRTRL